MNGWLQEGCELPAIDAPDDHVNDFLNPVIQLCGDFWCYLLEQMARSSSAPKAGKALVIAVVEEVVAAVWQAKWPGAQLLVYVLCNHLKDVVHGGAARTGKVDTSAREERELLLDVVGHLIAKVCLPAAAATYCQHACIVNDSTLLLRFLTSWPSEQACSCHHACASNDKFAAFFISLFPTIQVCSSLSHNLLATHAVYSPVMESTRPEVPVAVVLHLYQASSLFELYNSWWHAQPGLPTLEHMIWTLSFLQDIFNGLAH
jgi:hypothetical protein